MIFLYFIQLTLGILLFLPATVILIGSLRFPGKGSGLGITVAVIVMILSAFNIVGGSCFALKYSKMGLFESPMTQNASGN